MLERLVSRTTFLILAAAQLTAAFAQETKSHLVVFSPIKFENNTLVIIKNSKEEILNGSTWISGVPFYRDFVLPQGEYRLTSGERPWNGGRR